MDAFGLQAVSKTVVYVVGDDGTVLASKDGATWTQQTIPLAAIDLTSVSFVDEQNGWAVGTHTRYAGRYDFNVDKHR
eukprot:6872903-Pyramimonas_sp.AAC.2